MEEERGNRGADWIRVESIETNVNISEEEIQLSRKKRGGRKKGRKNS